MSKADELKSKNENLFERNTILLNENERLKKENAELRRDKEDLIFVRNAKADHINELKLELTKKADINHSLVEQMARLEEENNKYLDVISNYEIKVADLEQQIEKMKRHCNCKHRDSEGYCEVRRTYLMDLSYDGCDKWELED